jgi:hypothetical protein
MESVVTTSMTVRFLVEHYPNAGFTKCKVKRVSGGWSGAADTAVPTQKFI